MQDCSNSNIFLKPLFRCNFDTFVNNANLGAIVHTSNGAQISIVYRKICCNHNAFMVRRLSMGKNHHLTCYVTPDLCKVFWLLPLVMLQQRNITFVCVEVLRPSQPNGVMSSAVSLPNHTFTGQA